MSDELVSKDRLIIFAIVLLPDGNLRVQIASATEMSFTMQVWPGDVDKGKHDRMMVDLCTLAPAMMNVDAAMMEMMDGGDEKPAESDLRIIHTFIKTWRHRIMDSNVGFSGWPGNQF